MENQIPPPQTKHPSIFRITLSNLQIVIGVALLLATLFTAWTPGENSSLPAQMISNILTSPTPSPASKTVAPQPNIPLIGIVAGHWGNDSGAVCDDGFTEAQLNLEVASLVQKALTNLGYKVDLLKEFDKVLKGYQASALVSIHTDSCQYVNDQATGYKVAAAYVSPRLDRATSLAACLRGNYARVTGLRLHNTSVTMDMTSYHAFDEIDSNTPAAIIEIGFLNLDRTFLTANTNLVVQGIVDGVQCFMQEEGIAILPTAQATKPNPQATLAPTKP